MNNLLSFFAFLPPSASFSFSRWNFFQKMEVLHYHPATFWWLYPTILRDSRSFRSIFLLPCAFFLLQLCELLHLASRTLSSSSTYRSSCPAPPFALSHSHYPLLPLLVLFWPVPWQKLTTDDLCWFRSSYWYWTESRMAILPRKLLTSQYHHRCQMSLCHSP